MKKNVLLTMIPLFLFFGFAQVKFIPPATQQIHVVVKLH
jgi:hypothetical protein